MASKVVAKYLSTTKYSTLTLGGVLKLTGYRDSDWAGKKGARRSTSGMVYTFGDVAIVWRLRLQIIVAASSQEAEYVALAMCAREAAWLRKLMDDLALNTCAVPIKVDNTGAISHAKDDKVTTKTKHIDVYYKLGLDYAKENNQCRIHSN